MTSTETQAHRPSLADRIGIIIFMLAGLGIIIWGAVGTGITVATVGSGTVTASVRLIDTTVDIPASESGETIAMKVDSASITESDPTAMASGLAIAAPIAWFLIVSAIVVFLMLLARNTLRGRIFSRGNTRLVTATGMTALVGFGVVTVLERMVDNEILSNRSDGAFNDHPVMTADPLPFVLLAFAFGIVATAYTIGARLQRDQEGLV